MAQGGQRVDQLFWDLTVNAAPLIAGLGKAGRVMSKFAAAAATPAGALVALGAAFALVSVRAVRAAADIDLAMREVATLLPQTRAELDGLRESIIKLSTEVPEPPAQLTKGLYQVISAGITNTAQAMDVLAVSSRAAVAGLTSTFNAVDAITTVLNAWSLETEEAGRVADVLFQLVADGKIVFENINTSMGKVATTAGLAGVSLEEVSAGLSTLTKFGIDSIEAGNALNRMLFAIVDATDEQREAAARLGIEFTLTALQTKGLAGFMRDLQEATGGSLDEIIEIVPQIRAARAAFVIGGKGLQTYEKALNNAFNSAGKANEAFEEINGSIQKQAQLLKQNLVAPWLEFGQDILDTIVIPAIRTINRLFEEQQPVIRNANDVLREQIALAQQLGDQDRVRQLLLEQQIIKVNGELRNATLAAEIALLERARQLSEPEGFVGNREEARRNLEERNLLRLQAKSADDLKADLADVAARRDTILSQLRQEIRLEGDRIEELEEQKAALLEEERVLQDAVTAREAMVTAEEALKRLREGELPGAPSGEPEAAEEGDARRIENMARAIADQVERARRLQEIAAGLGVSIEGIPESLVDAVDRAKELSTEAERIQEFVTQYGKALREAGGDTEATVHFLSNMKREAAELVAGVDKFVRDFQTARLEATEFAELFEQTGVESSLLFDSIEQGATSLSRAMLELETAQNRLALAEIMEDAEGIAEAAFDVDRALKNVNKSAKAFAAILLQAGVPALAVAEHMEAVQAAVKATREEMEEMGDDWGLEKIGDLVESVARGVLGMVDAFDALDDSTRKVLEGIIDLGSAIAKIASGEDVVGGIIQGIGGASRLISGLFGGGNENLGELIQSQADLIRALDELRFAIISDLTGRQISELKEDLAGVGEKLRRDIDQGLGITDLKPEELAALDRAKDLGVDFFGPDGVITLETFERAMKALDALEISVFPDTLQGDLDGMKFRFDLLGDAAGDAAARFDETIKILRSRGLNRFADGLVAAMEEGGPEAARAFLNRYIEEFGSLDPAVRDALFQPGGIFHEASPEVIEGILGDMADVIDKMAEEGASEDGQTEGFRISREITERTAGIMVSALTTMIFRLENIEMLAERQALAAEALVAAFVQPVGISPPDVPDDRASGALGGSVSISIDAVIGEVTVGAGADLDPAQFEEVGAAAGRGFAESVDRTLNVNRIANSRALGI
jgi:TP901 family phage tail tape measure protein